MVKARAPDMRAKCLDKMENIINSFQKHGKKKMI